MNKKILGILLVVLFILATVIGFKFTNSVDDGEIESELSEEKIMKSSESKDMTMDNDEDMMTEKDVEKEMMDKEVTVINEGPIAPEFSLMDLEGNTVSLKDLKGEKLYVKFWASWCTICLSGLEEIDELSAEDNDVTVLTIVSPDFNGEQSEADFKEWFKTRGTKNMKVLLDTDGSITKTYGVRAYPTSVFIGSDGVVVGQFPGHIGSEQIKEFFKEIK